MVSNLMEFLDLLLVLCTCIATSAIATQWIILPSLYKERLGQKTTPTEKTKKQDNFASFLFEGDMLIDLNSAAEEQWSFAQDFHDWPALSDKLTKTFNNLPVTLNAVLAPYESKDRFDNRTIRIAPDGDMTRVTISPQSGGKQGLGNLTHFEKNGIDLAPLPIWFCDTGGTLKWKNKAFDELQSLCEQKQAEFTLVAFAQEAALRGEETPRHHIIKSSDDDFERWFDITQIAFPEGSFFYATDVGAVVESEKAQQVFVQTLARTFANLPIGLAIFDRSRRLGMFNPALVDLLSLSAEFLTSRPYLFSFFDSLRNQNVMPEPKNYGDWKTQIDDLAQAAKDGSYAETWSLPSGAVYSVSGRPHPDGTIAFQFEDITPEISLTRAFRSEVELSQSVLNRIPDVIAVFATNQRLVLTNTAFDNLFDRDASQNQETLSVQDVTAQLEQICHPSPIWGEIRDFVRGTEERAEWWAPVKMKNGQQAACFVFPVNNGSTLISLRMDFE